MRIPIARSHRSLAFGAALVLACALVVASSGPARAFDTTASFTGADSLTWTAGSGGNKVHIDPGGVVSFSYPTGFSTHNVDFGTTAPTSCAQTTPVVATGQPMPASPSGSGWAGSCTFNDTGTYTFFCDLHTGMRGTVLVGNVPDPPPSTGGGGSNGGGSQTGGGSASDPLGGLKLAKSQRGTKVSGSIADVVRGSDVAIEITAKPSALKTSSTKPVRVARLLKSDLAAGTYSFAIKLSSKAKKAIKQKGKLAVSVVVKLTPPGASAATATKTVTIRKKS